MGTALEIWLASNYRISAVEAEIEITAVPRKDGVEDLVDKCGFANAPGTLDTNGAKLVLLVSQKPSVKALEDIFPADKGWGHKYPNPPRAQREDLLVLKVWRCVLSAGV